MKNIELMKKNLQKLTIYGRGLMSKLKIINSDEINKRVENGLITVRKHPFLDIYICNYTHKTQYNGLWDEYTERCRGLIIDGSGHILNNPFPKFFNLGEKEYTMVENLPKEMPVITEKLDGMLGILYSQIDKLAITTRGAFDSPYAEWATNWLRLKGFGIDDFKKGYTYLFEIIYPRTELILLAVRNNSNSSELDHIKEAQELGVSYAREYSFDSVDDAVAYIEKCRGKESEGFVCRYSNGLRIKIKSTDYKRLHKTLTGISERDIWCSLRDTGNVDNIIENIPDEFFKWVKKVESELTVSKLEIMINALDIALDAKKLINRVEQAEYIIKHTENTENIRGIVFSLLDGRIKDAERTAWQKVKPSGGIFKKYVDDKDV